MVTIKRYDIGTGHVEILAEKSTIAEALELEAFYLQQDHGTDVVVWHEEDQ